MIVAIQGTHYGNNEAVKVMNALAVMGVATDQLTTIMLQFTNKTRKSAEQYLIGKNLQNESLIQDTSVPDISSGMDALCAHVFGQDDSAHFFSEVSRSLVTQKARNVFDLVVSSRKESFEKEIINRQRASRTVYSEDEQPAEDKDYLELLFESLSSVYKVVYVLMPSKRQELCQEILRYADVNIICVHQGMVEPVTHGGKREMFVVTDYCSGSVFNSKTLAQAYGQKIVYGCMHNIQYNDACASGTALEFLKNNLTATQNSAAYSFTNNIAILYNALMRKPGRKTTDVDPDTEIKKYDGPIFIQDKWKPITSPVVREVVTTGLFKKQTTETVKLVPGEEDAFEAPVMPEYEEEGIIEEPMDNMMDPFDEPAPVQEDIFIPDMPVEESVEEPIADFENSVQENLEEVKDDIVEQEVETSVKPEKKKFSLFGFGKKKDKEIAAPVTEELVEEPIVEEEPVIEEAPVENPEIASEPEAVEEPEIILPDLDDVVEPEAVSEAPAPKPKRTRRTKKTEEVQIEQTESAVEEKVSTGISETITPEPVKKTRKPRKKAATAVTETTSDTDGWTFN